MYLIARKVNRSTRIFPEVTADFYRFDLAADNLSPDRLLGCRLLMLSNKEIKPWQWLFNPKDDLELFRRLISTHRMAFEAEIQGQFERADYFWSAAYSGLKPLLADSSKWERIIKSLSDDCSPMEMDDPEKARSIFVSEVLLDIHVAFYNGEIQSESSVSRAFAHLEYVKALLSLSGLTKDDIYVLLSPCLNDCLRLCRDAGDLPEAVNACWALIDYTPDPDPYVDVLADLHTEYALSSQGDDDSSELLWSITCLEDITRDFPHCLRAYQSLGQLYKVQAEKLVAANQLDEALLATHKALSFNPKLWEAQALCDRLTEQIKNTHAAAHAADSASSSQVDRNPYHDASSDQPEAIVASEEYLASEEARQAQQGYKLASAYCLRRNIGLGCPTDKCEEFELHLLEAVKELSRSAPTDEANLETRWRTLAGKDPMLADLDAAAVCSYVSKHGAEAMPIQWPPAVAPVQNPPCLTVKQAKKQWPPEPLSYWFFSRKDLTIKARAIVAIILLLTGGVLGLREWWARSTRDQAFVQMLQSADHQQHLGVIEAAEEFLTNMPLFGKDTRTQRVLDYYDQSLVHWLIESRDQHKANTEERINRYERLVGSIRREESDEKGN